MLSSPLIKSECMVRRASIQGKSIWNSQEDLAKDIEAENTTAQSAPESSRWVRERNDFVFIDDGPILRHIANQPPCDLTVSKYWIHGLFCCMIRLSVSISNLTVLDPRFLWQVYSFQIFAKLFFVDFRTEGSTCQEIKLVSSSSDLQDCSGLGIATFGKDTFPNG